MKNLNFNDDELMKAAMGDLDDKNELYLCDNNTLNTDVIDNNQTKHSKGKKWIYILVAVLTIVIIGTSIFTILTKQDKNFTPVKQSENVVLSENEEIDKEIDEEVSVINSVNDGFLDVEKNYLVNNKLPEEKIAELLKEECEYAQSLVTNGLASSFSLEETGCITVDLTQGDKYIYIPEIEGMKAVGESGRIVTLQPNKSDFSNNSTDSIANNVMKSYDNYNFDKKDNIDESKVTLDAIINLKNSEVIIWDGHGNYTKKYHSILITGETAKHVKKLKKSQKFKNDEFFYTKDETPRVAINYKFFNNHFKKNDFKNALIFLGTCYSGKDTVLADTLRDKGAKTVFVTTNSISNDYCDKMTKTIFDNLIKGRNANDSLVAAIKRHGERDKRKLTFDIPDVLEEGVSGYFEEEIKNWDNFFHPAEIKIIGSKKFKLRNNNKKKKKKTPKTDYVGYADIIDSIEEQPDGMYGTARLDDGADNFYNGIVYCTCKDLNKDKIEELMICYGKDLKYYIDIYSTINGKAKKVGTIDAMNPSYTDGSGCYADCTYSDGVYIVSGTRELEVTFNSFNGKELIQSDSYFNDSGVECLINGDSVSWSEYSTARNEYPDDSEFNIFEFYRESPGDVNKEIHNIAEEIRERK